MLDQVQENCLKHYKEALIGKTVKFSVSPWNEFESEIYFIINIYLFVIMEICFVI